MSYTLCADTEAFKDLPGYKSILKAVLKAQIQHLVEQLAEHTNEESVVLTASTTDGTISHIGSLSGRVFLDCHEDFKSTFLQFCINYQTLASQQSEESNVQSRNAQKPSKPRPSVKRKKTVSQVKPMPGPSVYMSNQKPFQQCNLSFTPLHKSVSVKTEASESQESGRRDKTSDKTDNNVGEDKSEQNQSTESKEPAVDMVADKEWQFVDIEELMPAEDSEDIQNVKEDGSESHTSERTISQSRSEKRKVEEHESDTEKDLERAVPESDTSQDSPGPPEDANELHPFAPIIKVEPSWDTEDESGGIAVDRLDQPGTSSSVQARTNSNFVSMDGKPRDNANRFRRVDENEMDSYEEARQSKRTKLNTKWAVRMFQDWHAATYGQPLDTAVVTEEALGPILRKFYCEMAPQSSDTRSKKLGVAAQTYQRNTMKNIRTGLNRHLADIGRNLDIVHGTAFKMANRTLEGLMKEHMKSGLFRPTQHKPIIDKGDLERIFQYFAAAPSSPIVLRQCVWFNLGLHFVPRGFEFLQQLKPDSFNFNIDDHGKEYVTLTYETHQKNLPGRVHKEEVLSDRRMYATGSETCPVAMLKLLIRKTDTKAEMLFNKAAKEARLNPAAFSLWYTDIPLSKRTYSSFMADICRASNTSGWYTAHSICITASQVTNSGSNTRQSLFTAPKS